MSLAATHAATPHPHRGGTCTVALLLTTLTPDDTQWLRTVLADPYETSAGIARTLNTEGHRASQTALQRHRRGDCACPQ